LASQTDKQAGAQVVADFDHPPYLLRGKPATWKK